MYAEDGHDILPVQVGRCLQDNGQVPDAQGRDRQRRDLQARHDLG